MDGSNRSTVKCPECGNTVPAWYVEHNRCSDCHDPRRGERWARSVRHLRHQARWTPGASYRPGRTTRLNRELKGAGEVLQAQSDDGAEILHVVDQIMRRSWIDLMIQETGDLAVSGEDLQPIVLNAVLRAVRKRDGRSGYNGKTASLFTLAECYARRDVRRHLKSKQPTIELGKRVSRSSIEKAKVDLTRDDQGPTSRSFGLGQVRDPRSSVDRMLSDIADIQRGALTERQYDAVEAFCDGGIEAVIRELNIGRRAAKRLLDRAFEVLRQAGGWR